MQWRFWRVRPSWSRTRLILIVGFLLISVFTLFFWRLASLTDGLGPDEYLSRQHSQDSRQIINRGLNAPYHLLQLGLTTVINDDILALRLASVTVGLIILIFLFFFLRGWFGRTVAIFSSLIFIVTPWVILTARTATPNIMLLWPIVPIACLALMSRSKKHAGKWWLLFCLTVSIGIYTPGFIWLLLAGVILGSRRFLNISARINAVYLVAGLAIGILLAAPLILSLAVEPGYLKELFLVPSEWQSPVETLKSIAWSAFSLFWATRGAIDISVDRLPILNILQIVLSIFGLYALGSRTRKLTISLIALLVLSIIAAGLNNDPHLLIIGLPAIAIFIAAGLRYLYIEWRRIFPLNPFARGLAIGLISLVVATHLMYAVRYSLIAWPNTSQTKETYVLK